MPRAQRIFTPADLAYIKKMASLLHPLSVRIVGPNFTQEQVNYNNDLIASLRGAGYIVIAGKLASFSDADNNKKFSVIRDEGGRSEIYIFQ